MSWSDPPEVRFAEKLECNLDELGVYDIVGLELVLQAVNSGYFIKIKI